MNPTTDFGPPDGEQELSAASHIVAQAFAFSPQDARTWLETVGVSNLRLLREEGRVAASLVLVPMGQWFGGRSVPLVGISGVGVAPERRGQGTATRLMQACLRELRAQGTPLSGLYPATQPLYRRVGFEQAGARYEIRVKTSTLDFCERALALRPVSPGDEAALHDTYRRYARQRQGYLDRGPYVWNRVVHPRGEPAHGYLVEGRAGVEGYLYLVRRRRDPRDIWQELVLTDLVATTPAASRRLLRFLGDHRSLADEVVWMGGPDEPLLLLLREQSYQVKLHMHWMLRLLDVPAVLEARGYPAGLSGALHLEVEDDLIPENRGRFVLEVEGGSARVRRGGDGTLRLHVRALAALSSGFLSPSSLRWAGALEADAASLALASALFAGPAPAMPDMY